MSCSELVRAFFVVEHLLDSKVIWTVSSIGLAPGRLAPVGVFFAVEGKIGDGGGEKACALIAGFFVTKIEGNLDYASCEE